MRVLVRSLLVASLAVVGAFATSGRAEAASCYPATTKSTHALCFPDFTGYPGTGAQDFTFNLPDGAVLGLTLTNSGTVSVPPHVAPVYGTNSFGGVAFGDEDYLGIAGKPAFDHAGDFGPFTLSNVTLTTAAGRVISPITLAVIDAESVDNGDGPNGKQVLTWDTTGTPWAQLQLMPNPAGSIASLCTLSGIGTMTAYCSPNSNNAPAAAYILTTSLTSGQTVSMTVATSAAQAFAFGVELSKIAVQKRVASRETPTDQFTVQLARQTNVFNTYTTSGTGVGAYVGNPGDVVIAGDTYTLNEIAAGSTDLANYVSTVACQNANAGSATPLPPSGLARSVTVTPALDDEITCAFTNTALTLGITHGAAQTVAPAQAVTDTFTLTNSSLVAGTFTIAQPTAVAADGTTVTPTGYVFAGITYTTLAALQAAINAAGDTAAGGTIAVGVSYVVPSFNGPTVTTTLPATIGSGASVSPQATASETDTLPYATLTIAKTGTTEASPGGLIGYNVLVTNTGTTSAANAAFTDPLPTGIAIAGTPTCAATGGAACGTVVVGTGNPTIVSSTIPTLPPSGTVTFTIPAKAAAAGSYQNTGTITPAAGSGGSPASSSLTTTVAAANGLLKTVQNLTIATEMPGTANSAKPSDTLQYGLQFTNTTGQALTNVSFSDVVPASTTYVSAQCPAAGTSLPAGITACSATTSTALVGGVPTTTVTFTFTGTLAADATVATSFRVTVN